MTTCYSGIKADTHQVHIPLSKPWWRQEPCDVSNKWFTIQPRQRPCIQTPGKPCQDGAHMFQGLQILNPVIVRLEPVYCLSPAHLFLIGDSNRIPYGQCPQWKDQSLVSGVLDCSYSTPRCLCLGEFSSQGGNPCPMRDLPLKNVRKCPCDLEIHQVMSSWNPLHLNLWDHLW